MERTKKIKIITIQGFKYCGFLISQDSVFIEIEDQREGLIKIPLSNISFLQEVRS